MPHPHTPTSPPTHTPHQLLLPNSNSLRRPPIAATTTFELRLQNRGRHVTARYGACACACSPLACLVAPLVLVNEHHWENPWSALGSAGCSICAATRKFDTIVRVRPPPCQPSRQCPTGPWTISQGGVARSHNCRSIRDGRRAAAAASALRRRHRGPRAATADALSPPSR